jgi:hypothetical protein
MRIGILSSSLLLTAAMMSNLAFAIFDAQVLVGQRSGTAVKGSTSSDLSGTEIQATFHIDPIPLVPVAVGLYANQATYEPDVFDFDKLTGLEVGFQAYAWLPIGIAGFKPYAKVGYPLFSAIKADKNLTVGADTYTVSAVMETAGPHIAAGASWKPVPLLPMSILIEVDIGRQTMTSKDIDSTPALPAGTLDATEYTYDTTAFYIGVQAGL